MPVHQLPAGTHGVYSGPDPIGRVVVDAATETWHLLQGLAWPPTTGFVLRQDDVGAQGIPRFTYAHAPLERVQQIVPEPGPRLYAIRHPGSSAVVGFLHWSNAHKTSWYVHEEHVDEHGLVRFSPTEPALAFAPDLGPPTGTHFVAQLPLVDAPGEPGD